MLETHPDKTGSENLDEIMRVNEAWEGTGSREVDAGAINFNQSTTKVSKITPGVIFGPWLVQLLARILF